MAEENYNDDMLYQGKDHEFFKKEDLAYIITEIVCTILTIIGNSLVLLVFWSDHQKNEAQKIIHKYIISMALADLLIGVIGIPISVLASVGLPKQRFWCLASLSVQTSFAMVSVLALEAASTAKYLSLAHPLWFSTKFKDVWVNCMYLINFMSFTIKGLS